MTQIIAGHFGQQEQAHQAIEKLLAAGFSEDRISTFYLNPAGQHDLFPVGGDRDKSPGAEESTESLTRGGAAGGTIGGAIGAAGIPVAGPVAPAIGVLVGAHVGSLIGTLSGMKEANETTQGNEDASEPRKAGMMVAVATEQSTDKDSAVNIFRSLAAEQIERSEGIISNGNWQDFDPLSIPDVIH